MYTRPGRLSIAPLKFKGFAYVPENFGVIQAHRVRPHDVLGKYSGIMGASPMTDTSVWAAAAGGKFPGSYGQGSTQRGTIDFVKGFILDIAQNPVLKPAAQHQTAIRPDPQEITDAGRQLLALQNDSFS